MAHQTIFCGPLLDTLLEFSVSAARRFFLFGFFFAQKPCIGNVRRPVVPAFIHCECAVNRFIVNVRLNSVVCAVFRGVSINET